MKNSTYQVTKSIIASVFLTVASFFAHPFFFDFSLSQVNLYNIDIVASSLRIGNPILFSLLIGSIPILHLIISRIVKLKRTEQSYFLYAIILLFGVLSWWYRIHQLTGKFESSSMYNIGFTYNSKFNANHLYFSEFLAVGLFFGALIGFLLLFIVRRVK